MKRNVTRAGLLFATLCAGALASTCDMPATFGDEYYDTSINYIEDIPFLTPPLASDPGLTEGTDVLLDTPARWDWPWRGNMGNSYPYMTLSDTGAIVDTAQSSGSYILAAGEAIWRLELANLFIDGNFESGTALSSIEASTDAAVEASSTPIHGVSLGFSTNTDDAYVQWHMIDLLDDIANYAATGAAYYLRMLIEPSIELLYFNIQEIDFGTMDTGTNDSATPDGQSLFIPGSLTGFSDDNRFVVTKKVYTPTTIDDVRAVRSDVDPFVRLLLRPTDTSPELVPGQYELSLWVRTASADRYYNESRTNEPYAARYITLRMKQINEDTGESTKSTYAVYAVSGAWQHIVVRMEDPNNMDIFDPDTENAVMELSIAPCSIDAPDAGAVEIAAPALYFHIDSY